MAFANNINRDMTSADARAVAGQDSWSDIYPDDFDFEADPWEFLGDHRLFFDTDGAPHFAPGKNPFSGDLARSLIAGEKDGLLGRKTAGDLGGAIRDTRSRYGEPKEWDHLVVGLTREESERLGPEGVKTWAQVVIRAMQDSPAGDGKRQMLVTPVHTDTDNIHLQFLLHRIPVNETTKTAGASYELSRNSEAAGQMKQINQALEAAGLPMISDFRMGAYSVSEPRAISAEELARGAERVKEAGGVTPPDMTTGPVPTQRERVSPDMRHLDAMLADAIKRQKEAEGIATSAATAVAAAQHARAALEQYEAEVKAREAAEADLASTQSVLEATSAKLRETADVLSVTREEVETVTGQLAESVALTAAKVEQIETLTSEKSELTTELTEVREVLAQTDAALEQEQALRQAEAKAATDREVALQTEMTELAKAAADREAALRSENAELSSALEQARGETQEAKEALQVERDTFLDRARTWAEEHVKAPLVAQLDALKTELADARREFSAQMAEAQRAFMDQLRALTAGLRQQGEPTPPARRRFPSWARKPFDQLSASEKEEAAKSLATRKSAPNSDIAQDLPLETYVNGIHSLWLKQQEADQANTPAPNAPKA